MCSAWDLKEQAYDPNVQAYDPNMHACDRSMNLEQGVARVSRPALLTLPSRPTAERMYGAVLHHVHETVLQK